MFCKSGTFEHGVQELLGRSRGSIEEVRLIMAWDGKAVITMCMLAGYQIL